MSRLDSLETPFLEAEIVNEEPAQEWRRVVHTPPRYRSFAPTRTVSEEAESCPCAHEALSPLDEAEADDEQLDAFAELEDAVADEDVSEGMEAEDDTHRGSGVLQEIDIRHLIEERESSSPEFENQTPKPPAKLVLLSHWHVPRTPDPSAASGFKIGAPTVLTTSDMNPGFVDASDALITDTAGDGLQTCLSKVVRASAARLLANKTNPVAGDRVRVAIVDLTGSKLWKPDFAGWGSSVAMYGASVPKILGLYGAFQVRSDLRRLADDKSITDGITLEKEARAMWKAAKLSQFPDLVWLFDIRKWKATSGMLDFAPDATKAFADIMHNCPAGTIIQKASLPFIGSLTWQSGLFHPQRGGLWLQASYCGKGSWASPVSSTMHNVTALSAATFFTLLAQERLVDDSSSADIKNFLRSGCVTGLLPSSVIPVVSSKCGLWNGFVHDCLLADDGTVRYAAAVVSRLFSSADHSAYRQLWIDIDALIRKNNQSPKPGC